MTDLVYYIVLGLLALMGLVLIFRHPDGEDPLVSRRRYTLLIVIVAAVPVISLLRFGALGALVGGC